MSATSWRFVFGICRAKGNDGYARQDRRGLSMAHSAGTGLSPQEMGLGSLNYVYVHRTRAVGREIHEETPVCYVRSLPRAAYNLARLDKAT